MQEQRAERLFPSWGNGETYIPGSKTGEEKVNELAVMAAVPYAVPAFTPAIAPRIFTLSLNVFESAAE